MQPNNPLTEIGVILISVALIAAATTLLVLGKIDFTGATVLYGLVAGIYGVNGAFKAASPAQQALLAQVLSSIGTNAASSTQPTPAPTPIDKVATSVMEARPKQ